VPTRETELRTQKKRTKRGVAILILNSCATTAKHSVATVVPFTVAAIKERCVVSLVDA
jgi:hypothetical protein